MQKANEAFEQAEVVVFASSIYFWTISGLLGNDYSQALTWYHTFERNLGWKNCGEVLGTGKTKEAYSLGKTI